MNPHGEQPLMRMKELAALTGLSKSAIRFYLSQGLAPGAVRQGRNSALYSHDTLRGLELVRQLREDQDMSLEQIRQVLVQVGEKGAREDAGELKQALAALGGGEPRYSARELSAQSGLPLAEVQKALSAGLLVPLAAEGERLFDDADLNMAAVLAELLGMGVTWKEMAAFGEAARHYLALQMTLQQRLVNGLPRRGVLTVSSALLRLGRTTNRYLFDRNLKHAVVQQLDGLKEKTKPAGHIPKLDGKPRQ